MRVYYYFLPSCQTWGSSDENVKLVVGTSGDICQILLINIWFHHPTSLVYHGEPSHYFSGTWSELIGIDQTWSDMIRHDQTWSDMLKWSKTCLSDRRHA